MGKTCLFIPSCQYCPLVNASKEENKVAECVTNGSGRTPEYLCQSQMNLSGMTKLKVKLSALIKMPQEGIGTKIVPRVCSIQKAEVWPLENRGFIQSNFFTLESSKEMLKFGSSSCTYGWYNAC